LLLKTGEDVLTVPRMIGSNRKRRITDRRKVHHNKKNVQKERSLRTSMRKIVARTRADAVRRTQQHHETVGALLSSY